MFTGFVGFPCLYLPETKTPWQNSIISPIFQQHFSTNRRNFILSRKPLYFHAKLRYYHGNCRLLPDSTIFPPIAIFSAALKNTKIGAHHPPWWTPPGLKNLDFKPFFNTFACEYPTTPCPLHSANCLRQFTSCRSRASPYESSQKHPFVSKLPAAVSASPRMAHCLRAYGINSRLPPVPPPISQSAL